MASKNPDFKGATPEKLAKALARPVKRSRSGKAPAPPPAEDEGAAKVRPAADSQAGVKLNI